MYLSLSPNHTSSSTFSLIGQKAPPFKLTTFDNKKLTSASLNNKAIVLNFWSSWCIPCIEEVEVLNSSHEKYKNEDIVFMGVNIWDDEKNAIDFINRHDAHYLNGFDPNNEIQVNYGIEGVPETYFISKEGIIINKFQGQLTDNIANYFCAKLLAK